MSRPLLAWQLWRRFGFRDLNFRAMQRVAVYPGLSLAYNRVKKNANTSVVILMRELETGVVEDRSDAKSKSRTLASLSVAELRALGSMAFFVVIRNPYTRVLSAFLDKFRGANFRSEFGAFELSPRGFQEFVFWLRDGGLDRNEHWDLQTKLMFLPLAKYDRVIRFENFKAEMSEFLRARNVGTGTTALGDLYPSDALKRTAADEKIAQYYSEEAKQIVSELYRTDFERLGYSLTFPGTPPGPLARPGASSLGILAGGFGAQPD